MIPEKFAYHRPASVAEAARLLAEIDDSWPLAGGHSLIPMMKLRFAAPAALVDLAAIESLRAIDVGDEIISLGATVTQRQIIESKPLAAACPLLAEAALVIADPQVRYCGTIGGNVANGDPGNDMPAVMQALGARYRLFGKSGERTVAALDYYEGPFMTARAADEILTAIEIPRPPAGAGFALRKTKTQSRRLRHRRRRRRADGARRQNRIRRRRAHQSFRSPAASDGSRRPLSLVGAGHRRRCRRQTRRARRRRNLRSCRRRPRAGGFSPLCRRRRRRARVGAGAGADRLKFDRESENAKETREWKSP